MSQSKSRKLQKSHLISNYAIKLFILRRYIIKAEFKMM